MALKLPPTYLLKTHFERDQDELHRLEREIDAVWNIHEAEIVLGRVSKKERALYELRKFGLKLGEIVKSREPAGNETASLEFPLPTRKRRKVDASALATKGIGAQDDSTESGSSTEDEDDHEIPSSKPTSPASLKRKFATSIRSSSPEVISSPIAVESYTENCARNIIKVLNLNWYLDSRKAGHLLPIREPYLVCEVQILADEKTAPPPKITVLPAPPVPRSRAKTPPQTQNTHYGFRGSRSPASQKKTRPSQLVHEDTSDHEHEINMPPLPEYCKTRYCCQRPTPMHSPNDAFIEQLKIIRRARELESNEVIGHDFSTKSYSASIAAIAAYPYTLTSVKEVMRLQACGERIGMLWHEWKEYGRIQEVEDIRVNERLNCLNLFYGIYQVGEARAREFHDRNGWRDLDDVTEYGWSTLTRDQQIGLKYYDELALRIPRHEVESTGAIILSHANSIHPGFKICIVGGYRRGKPDSGDMDYILSHPNEELTKNFLGPLLDSLGADRGDGWITHELTVSTKNSERGQTTLSWRGAGKKRGKRSGFDTLDHAFVVWQDPNFTPDVSSQINTGGKIKNPNIHRRVDIIISPWKTAGCAVLGWSGGNMFERDLRSYCRNEKGWKFDSSGIRSLSEGTWMDLETREGEKDGITRDGKEVTLEEKERRVFEGLGLEYRLPTERCTH